MDMEKEIKKEISNMRNLENKAYEDGKIKMANQLGQIINDLIDTIILGREI